MAMNFTTQTQQLITLGRELGKGGEGIVYDVVGRPSQVAKLYHESNRTKQKEHKLQAMIANPPQDESRTFSPPHVSIAWPQELFYTQGQFVGFLMPRIEQSPDIFKLYNPATRMKEFPGFDWRYAHRTAQNLAIALHALHARGYVMGDVNQKNILVTPSALVTLVDTDSFQVQDSKGTMHRCPVGVPEYTPPEMQGIKFDQADRNPFHDNFGLAVLIFQLLMEGYHPFTGAPVDPSVSIKGEVYLHCIKQGIFPYQSNPSFAPPPNAPVFEVLHPELQVLFLRSFINGHFIPAARPSAFEWVQALASGQKGLIQCHKNLTHWFVNTASACPWCKRELRNAAFGTLTILSQQSLPPVSSSTASVPPHNVSTPHMLAAKPQSFPTTSNPASITPIANSSISGQSSNFFVKLMRGDFGLARTYWGLGAGVGTIVNILFDFLESNISDALFGLIGLAYIAYIVMWFIGVWRASNRYTGPRIWSILAKIIVIIASIVLAGIFIAAMEGNI
jgi:DNA-binding helix-hairpin-helix protein with protein kinase domain